MTLKDEINERYFEWMSDLVCGDRYADGNSYYMLLMHLHNTEFRYSIPLDENRAKSGLYLRYSFTSLNGCEHLLHYIEGPCSVLEMMVALTIHCEDDIMEDAEFGNRTCQWFWEMIVNLGLGSMTDEYYDEDYVTYVLDRFLDRRYEPDGKGGLFRIRNVEHDLRDVEIFTQLCWYLDTI